MADPEPHPRCADCGTLVDAPFHRQSGGLCADCLADNALPLTRFSPRPPLPTYKGFTP